MVERFYRDRFQSTGTKRLLPLNGEVFVKVLVQGKVRGKNRTSKEVGKSGLTSLRNKTEWHSAFTNAQYNAMYQFRTRYGASGERILKVLDTWNSYPMINGYRGKRVKRNGKYYTYVFDSKGKIKTYSRWKSVRKEMIRPEV